VAALAGPTPAYADQIATGSMGTVQAQPPAVDVGAGVSAPTTVDPTGTSSSNPTASVSATTQPSTGGTQTADSSVGTAQVGNGPQSASNSVGTVQARPPTTAANASATAPTTASVANGVDTNPSAVVSASAQPSSSAPQSADSSIGTAQVGGGGPQTATGSAGTVQAAYPGLNADGSLASPTHVGIGDGLIADPTFTTSAILLPASGGTQTADSSIGTAQVGGGGPQTATGSAGTVQVANPGALADGSLASPVSLGVGDGLFADPTFGTTAGVMPATGGTQTADSSIGTAQVGGGGSQSASSSVGTVQAAMPAATATGGADSTPSAVVDVTVQPGTGGTQSADNSVGTVQLGGGGPQTAPGPTGTGTAPAGGGSGTFLSTAGSPTAATPTVAATGAPASGLPVSSQQTDQPIPKRAVLGVRTPITPSSPVTLVRSLATLPFTGLALWFVMFFGLMLIASGLTTRKAAQLV
jgi:hypothetical protein